MTIINTREDLDSVQGTPEYEQFMSALEGTLYRVERDDLAKQWTVVLDESTVNKFGFTAADFPDVERPTAPQYVAEDRTQDIIQAIQSALDSEAKARGYDNIISACSYAGYENAFQAEAVQLGKWRSAVWAAAYAYLAEVKAGTKEMPGADEVISIMPKVADYA